MILIQIIRQKKSYYDSRTSISLNNRNILPFVVYRDWNDNKAPKAHFDIIENFVFFYNLKRENCRFVDVTKSGEKVVVVLINKICGVWQIKVRREYLTYYLTKKKMFLVRVHSNAIFATYDPKQIEVETSNYIESNSNYNYKISIFARPPDGQLYNILSDLEGSDVIEPCKH